MRLAYFTPLPPSKSGIADYNSELLPYLAKGAEISVFVEEADEIGENRDRGDFSVHDACNFYEIHARRPFDLCVYHLGNNPYSRRGSIRLARRGNCEATTSSPSPESSASRSSDIRPSCMTERAGE
jgi:hypothetical protein